MTDRNEEISNTFSRWLKRYSPPLSMRDDLQTQQDEANALLRTLLKFAPANFHGVWLEGILERLSDQMKTRAWPTQNEIGAVCSNTRKERVNRPGSVADDEWTLDPHLITSKRMKNGEAVGEGWLYGRMACELIQRGLVDQETMTRYRSAAFFARKDIYKEEAALAWEAERKAAHESAKATVRDPKPMQHHAINIPDKTAPTKGWAAE